MNFKWTKAKTEASASWMSGPPWGLQGSMADTVPQLCAAASQHHAQWHRVSTYQVFGTWEEEKMEGREEGWDLGKKKNGWLGRRGRKGIT